MLMVVSLPGTFTGSGNGNIAWNNYIFAFGDKKLYLILG